MDVNLRLWRISVVSHYSRLLIACSKMGGFRLIGFLMVAKVKCDLVTETSLLRLNGR